MSVDSTSNQVQRRSSRKRRVIIDDITVVDSDQAESASRPTVAFDLTTPPLAREQHLGRSGTLTLYKKLGLVSTFELDDRLNPSLARGRTVVIDIKNSTGAYQRFFTGYILDSHYDGNFKTDIRITDVLALNDFPSSIEAIGLTSVKGPTTITAPSGATIESIVALFNTNGPVDACPIPAINPLTGVANIPNNGCTYGVTYTEVTAGSLNLNRRNIVVSALQQAGIPQNNIQIPPVSTNGGEQCVRVAPFGQFNVSIQAPPGRVISSIRPVSTNPGVDFFGNPRPDCPLFPAGGTQLSINVPAGCEYDVCYGTGVGSSSGLSDQLSYTTIKNAGDSLVSAAQKILNPTLNWLWVDSLGIVRIAGLPSVYVPKLARVSAQIDAPTRNERAELIPSIVRSYGTTIRKLYSQFFPGQNAIPSGEQSVNYYGQAYLPALQTSPFQQKVNEFASEYCTSGDQHAQLAKFELNRSLALKNGRPFIDEVVDELLIVDPFTVILVDGARYFIDAPTWAMANDEFVFTANLLFIDNGSIPTASAAVANGGLGGGGLGGTVAEPVRSNPAPPPATPAPEPPPSPPPSPPAPIPAGPINSFCSTVPLTFTSGGQTQTIPANTTFTLQTGAGGTGILLNGVLGGGPAGWNNSVYGGWSTGACDMPGMGGGGDNNCIGVDPGQAYSVPGGMRVASATPIAFNNASCPAIAAGTTVGGTAAVDCGYVICFEKIPVPEQSEGAGANIGVPFVGAPATGSFSIPVTLPNRVIRGYTLVNVIGIFSFDVTIDGETVSQVGGSAGNFAGTRRNGSTISGTYTYTGGGPVQGQFTLQYIIHFSLS